MGLGRRKRVPPEDPMAVVTRFLEACSEHDSDALDAIVHPEFESFQPVHPTRDLRGGSQTTADWLPTFAAGAEAGLRVLRASTTGDTVWVEVHADGEAAEAAGVLIVGVEKGRVRWVRSYGGLIETTPVDHSGADVQVEPEPGPLAVAAPVPDDIWGGPDDDAAAMGTGFLAGAGPWLVEQPTGPQAVADDEAPAPPEPGLRLVAPAPLPVDTGGPEAAPDAAVDEANVEILVAPPPAVETSGSTSEDAIGTEAAPPGEAAPAPAPTDEAHRPEP